MTDKLFKGYQRFREGYFEKNKDRLELLADGQAPEIAMVSCCDSRVDPGILFDVDPGEIFVIRNVANLVPPYETTGSYHGTSAALEFAVTSLRVKQIVVLGHANCGGIRSLMENETSFQAQGFIDSWMNLAAAAKKEVLAREDLQDMEQRLHACEKTAVSHSLKNLMLYPWIKDRVEAGNLELIGCFYDLRNGDLQMLDKINASLMPE
jgi:carbonic anhydrase